METKKKQLTAAQKAAVETRGRNLMISAAAGSGKTSTLTQRIIALLTDREHPADITSMLIVTFTTKAAGELRQRITDAVSKALAETPGDLHLSRQLIAVGAADICTIDSYYLSLIRENFQKLGLPSAFRMADPAETEILSREVADRVIERCFATDPDFADFADILTTVRSDADLTKMLQKLAGDTATLSEGPASLTASADLLDAEAEGDFFDSRTGILLKNALLPRLRDICTNLQYVRDTAESADGLAKYAVTAQNDLDAAFAIYTALKNGSTYRAVRDLVCAYVPEKLGSAAKGYDPELKDNLKDIRDNSKNFLQKLAAAEFALKPAELVRAMHKTAAFQRTAARAVTEFRTSFREAKNARMIVDFSDLPVYVLQLLRNPDGTPTETAFAQQKKYEHIFVDEYQDTNAFQDRIFSLISRGNNLFLVGDVKQSIYAFRGARPSVFASYRSRWLPLAAAAADAPAAIYMSENFRCAPHIITFTNLVCGNLFSEAEKNAGYGGGIDYRREDGLIYAGQTKSDVPVSLYACEGVEKPSPDDTADDPADTPEDAPTAAEKNGIDTELRCIVRKIREIAARRADPVTHAPAYADIAVLTRDTKFLSKIADALTAVGIPFSNNAQRDMFENPEVLLLYSVLSAIDNPMRDTSLAGALRSPVFGFTLTDLVNVRLGNRTVSLWESLQTYVQTSDAEPVLAQKCREAISRLTAYRALAEETPVDRFVRLLWRDTGADGYAGSNPDTARQKPSERRQNLHALYEFARSFQAGGFRTLHDFVSFISGILADGTKIDLPAAPAVGAVSLMTVHKSKGLEFPVVLLCGASNGFNAADSRAVCVFTDRGDIGAVPKLTDPTGMSIQDTPLRLALAQQTDMLNTEEEIRILYVALTRAKEELCITAHGSSGYLDKLIAKAKQLRSRPAADLLGACDNWFEWMLCSLSGMDSAKGNGFFRIYRVSPADMAQAADTKGCSADEPAEVCAKDAEAERSDRTSRREAAYRKIRAAVTERYPYTGDAKIPAKLSVSALYPDLLTDAEKENTAVLPAQKEEKIPRFLGGEAATAAEKGTATHLFLQFCDFTKLDGTESAAERERERLVAAGFLPRRTADLVRTGEISRFARSRFFSAIRSARSVERERRFNILMPAAEFTADAALQQLLADRKVLVQGVIDLLLETADGSIVLCDYKTDRLPPEVRGDEEAVRALMTERHAEQLKYYAEAIESLCGKRPDRVLVFPLAYGEAVEIFLPVPAARHRQ